VRADSKRVVVAGDSRLMRLLVADASDAIAAEARP
jgi:hypothetical protein